MSVELLTSALLRELPGVVHGFSTRKGGASAGSFATLNISPRVGDVREHVEENRRQVLMALGRPEASWLALKQVHGDQVLEVTRHAGRAIEGDALLTHDRGAALVVVVADCVPILLADTSGSVVAAVHAGWRGTRAKIAARAVARLAALGHPPAKLRAAIGPAIGPCCFTIGDEVVAELRAAYPAASAYIRMAEPTRMVADLWALNRAALVEAGMAAEHIDVLRHCTACTPELFFSHRRDRGITGRQAGIIALAPVS